jgi:phosphoserine phosphatase
MEQLKLICFDLNKTLIRENTWYNLNIAVGVTPERDQELLEKYEAGEITYTEWFELLRDQYINSKKATKEFFEKIIFNYKYVPFAKETIQTLKQKGYHTALVTGAMDILAQRVATELGIDHWRAHHRIIFTDEGYLKDILVQGNEQETKVRQLREICKEAGIQITECAAVGDGDNDLRLFQETHHGVTFTGSRIETHAWRVIENLNDLTIFL